MYVFSLDIIGYLICLYFLCSAQNQHFNTNKTSIVEREEEEKDEEEEKGEGEEEDKYFIQN